MTLTDEGKVRLTQFEVVLEEHDYNKGINDEEVRSWKGVPVSNDEDVATNGTELISLLEEELQEIMGGIPPEGLHGFRGTQFEGVDPPERHNPSIWMLIEAVKWNGKELGEESGWNQIFSIPSDEELSDWREERMTLYSFYIIFDFDIEVEVGIINWVW